MEPRGSSSRSPTPPKETQRHDDNCVNYVELDGHKSEVIGALGIGSGIDEDAEAAYVKSIYADAQSCDEAEEARGECKDGLERAVDAAALSTLLLGPVALEAALASRAGLALLVRVGVRATAADIGRAIVGSRQLQRQLAIWIRKQAPGLARAGKAYGDADEMLGPHAQGKAAEAIRIGAAVRALLSGDRSRRVLERIASALERLKRGRT